MSNEARRNPKSSQFIDPNPPKYRLGAMVDVIAVPSEKWIAANPAVEGEPTHALCPEEELECVFVVHGFYAETSALTTADKHPQGAAKFLEMGRVPFLTYQRVVKHNNPGVAWLSDAAEKPGLDS